MIILTKANRNVDDSYLNNATYMYLFDKFRNFILYDYYDYFEYKIDKNYYIRYLYFRYKLNEFIYFNYSGQWHREDGPAYIWYNKNGEIDNQEYFLNDEEYCYEDYLLDIEKLV